MMTQRNNWVTEEFDKYEDASVFMRTLVTQGVDTKPVTYAGGMYQVHWNKPPHVEVVKRPLKEVDIMELFETLKYLKDTAMGDAESNKIATTIDVEIQTRLRERYLGKK